MSNKTIYNLVTSYIRICMYHPFFQAGTLGWPNLHYTCHLLLQVFHPNLELHFHTLLQLGCLRFHSIQVKPSHGPHQSSQVRGEKKRLPRESPRVATRRLWRRRHAKKDGPHGRWLGRYPLKVLVTWKSWTMKMFHEHVWWSMMVELDPIAQAA